MNEPVYHIIYLEAPTVSQTVNSKKELLKEATYAGWHGLARGVQELDVMQHRIIGIYDDRNFQLFKEFLKDKCLL